MRWPYAEAMRREDRLDVVLAALVRAGPAPVWERAPDDLAFDDALASVLASWSGGFERSAQLAAAALDAARDPDCRGLARAAAGLATAGWADAAFPGDPLAEAARDAGSLSPALAEPILALVGEAALACARLELAAEVFAAMGALPSVVLGREDHPFLTFVRCTAARIRVFSGDIAGADAALAVAAGGATRESEVAFVSACAAVIDGNADRRRAAQRRCDELLASGIAPDNAWTSGIYVLAAYAAIALGDVASAVRLILSAGGDPDLARLRIIDRAICFEMLVHAAVDDDDLDAAQAWAARAHPLAEHPIANSTVDRIDSRVALLAGEPERALALALRAIERAEARGRVVEAAEGEIVAANARIAQRRAGTAAERLAEVVSHASDRGHDAVRASAARLLRSQGRRLPPASQGWAALSAREREVAREMATGATNAQIAAALYISPHTVRMHVSRVLHAFGVATRAGVAAAVAMAADAAPESAASPPSSLSPSEPHRLLTRRQREAAERAAAGMSNAAIARDLGITESTVEKHLGAALERLGVRSRAGISGALRGSAPVAPDGVSHPDRESHPDRVSHPDGATHPAQNGGGSPSSRKAMPGGADASG